MRVKAITWQWRGTSLHKAVGFALCHKKTIGGLQSLDCPNYSVFECRVFQSPVICARVSNLIVATYPEISKISTVIISVLNDFQNLRNCKSHMCTYFDSQLLTNLLTEISNCSYRDSQQFIITNLWSKKISISRDSPHGHPQFPDNIMITRNCDIFRNLHNTYTHTNSFPIMHMSQIPENLNTRDWNCSSFRSPCIAANLNTGD